MLRRLSSGVLILGGLAVVGAAALLSGGSTPAVHAQQAECPVQDGSRCLFIAKETDPGGSTQDFDFTHMHDGSTDNFSLEDGEEVVFLFTDNEPHVVTEDVPEGWVLTGIECTSPGVDIDLDEANATITATFTGDGQQGSGTARCVFTNERVPTATPTATSTQTQTPTATATGTPANTATPTATTPPATSVPPTATPTSPIVPPSTGSGGLK